jgi:eukaryotic-like serine/threonine-protein kinase
LTLCWRARDGVLDRPVFVKVLNPALAQDKEIRARFEREAKAVARLDHPNLVRIYEYGEDADEGMYMILEWVEGETLAQQIAKGKRFSGDEFVTLARELLSGLAALHKVGILHRDLKPENVLAREIQIPGKPDGPSRRTQFKITDFSLAALRDAPKLTHHEAIVGTPAYMAPEQAAGGQPTERSDLFSLGVMLYEAATGANPLIGETMLDTLRRIRESDVSFEHTAIRNLPPTGRILLEKLLRKSPGDRPQSAHDALSLLSGDGAPKAPDEIHSRHRNRRFALIAAMVIVVGGILIWDAGKPRPSDTMSAPADTSTQLQQSVKPLHTDGSIPEFRNPALDTNAVRKATERVKPKPTTSPAEARGREANTDTDSATPDSVDVTINTEPWAHVFYHGQQIGTTPLSSPLRLPAGDNIVVLRNPAFPPIDLPVNVKESKEINVQLSHYVTRIGARVEPWGELYIDGEHVGTTPIPRPVYVSPGHHSIRITHPKLGSVQRDVDAAAGQVLDLEVNMNTGQFLVAMDVEGRP